MGVKFQVVQSFSNGQAVRSGACELDIADILAGSAKKNFYHQGWREGRGDGRLWRGREWVEIRVEEAW